MSCMWAVHDVEVRADLRLAYVDAVNAVVVDTWGRTDFCREERELFAAGQDERYEQRVRLVAVDDDGSPLGHAALELPRVDNTRTAYVEVGTVPAARGQGIGGALYGELVARARRAGRTVLMASTDHPSEPHGAGTLAPPTGAGRVSTTAPGVSFALHRGFRLEQVERHSVLDVPLEVADHADRTARAQAVAGDEYRVHTWSGATPAWWLDQMAVLHTRMSTDVPTAGLDWTEERWDAERVRNRDHEHARRGVGYLTAVVEHVPSATLVGYTSILTVPHTPLYVHQDDTLVLREHRGRHLGMLLKLANLARLADEHPEARRVGTWNAQENSPMLAINVELGFRPAGGSGEWQLTLT